MQTYPKAPRRLLTMAIALGAALWSALPASACRCRPSTLEDYFERADVVLIGKVDRIIESSLTEGVAIEVTPQFRQQTFKGSLDGVALRTPLGSASCGVPVEVGASYVIFAHVEASSGIGWFDSCSGARPYAVDGGGMGFQDLPDDRVVPLLLELALALESQVQSEPPSEPASRRDEP